MVFLDRRCSIISIHALREEGDDHLDAAYEPLNQFLSTPSARRATRSGDKSVKSLSVFLSTPSARRATVVVFQHAGFHQFLSTPSARRATTEQTGYCKLQTISIHALREEGDPERNLHPTCYQHISIHALREEGD